MVDSHEPETPIEVIRAQVEAARLAKASSPMLKRDTKNRRAVEQRQRKSRVNTALLRGVSEARDEIWTIRARPSHVKSVKALAAELSEPGRKFSIAELMDEAIEMLLARYRGQGDDDA